MSELSLAVAPLETVTATISKLHTKQQEHAQKAWENAMEIGRLLSETRPTLKHGEWLNWTDQLPFSDRTARNYIRVYENRDNPKLETVSNLKEAYQLLTEPKAAPKELPMAPIGDIDGSRFIPQPGHGLLFHWHHKDQRSRLNDAEVSFWIEPSTHEGFYFVTKIIEAGISGATAEGNRRPFRIDAKFMARWADEQGVPADVEPIAIEAQPLAYNRFLYDSEAEAKEANMRHVLGR